MPQDITFTEVKPIEANAGDVTFSDIKPIASNPFKSPAEAIARGATPEQIRSASYAPVEDYMDEPAKPEGDEAYVTALRAGHIPTNAERTKTAAQSDKFIRVAAPIAAGAAAPLLLPEIAVAGVPGAILTGAAGGGASGGAGTITKQATSDENPFRIRSLREDAENAGIGAASGAAVGAAIPLIGRAARPAARFVSSEVLPQAEHLPFGVGRGIRAAAGAPSMVRAAVRGAVAPAALGAGEGALYGIRRGDPEQAVKDAAYGAILQGTLGALSGASAYGVNRIAGIPAVGVEPEPEPFARTPDEPVSEPAVQNRMEFPAVAGPKEAPAVRLPEPEAPTEKPLHTDTQDLARRIDEATGNTPAVKGVPLREQPRIAPPKPAEPEAAAPKSLEEKYPDKAQRQLVHANGEEIYKAAKGNPEVMKQIHALSRVDLRQALINAGEDMAQTTVSDSRFAGPGSITRQEAFHRLLQKGYTPGQIVYLGNDIPLGNGPAHPPPAGARVEESDLTHR